MKQRSLFCRRLAMHGVRRRAGIIALALLLGACALPPALPETRPAVTAAECPPVDADPDGYLRAICLYVVAEGIKVAPARPNEYAIKRMEIVEKEGRTEVWVFLNCCYLGDIAVIDPAIGQVIDFRVGAK